VIFEFFKNSFIAVLLLASVILFTALTTSSFEGAFTQLRAQ
jgi:hypothetical protein